MGTTALRRIQRRSAPHQMDFFFTRPFRDLAGRPFPNSAFYGDGVSLKRDAGSDAKSELIFAASLASFGRHPACSDEFRLIALVAMFVPRPGGARGQARAAYIIAAVCLGVAIVVTRAFRRTGRAGLSRLDRPTRQHGPRAQARFLPSRMVLLASHGQAQGRPRRDYIRTARASRPARILQGLAHSLPGGGGRRHRSAAGLADQSRPVLRRRADRHLNGRRFGRRAGYLHLARGD